MISVEEKAGLDLVTLSHGKVNAMDLELLECLSAQIEKSRSEEKAILFTGNGSCFSAGVDLFRVVRDGKPYLETFLPALSQFLLLVFTHPRPVVAAVNGPAIAGGCILALCCDWRIGSAEKAKIGASELLVGVPFPSVPLEILRFAAPYCFEELALTGRSFAGEQALRRGLFHELSDPKTLLTAALSQLEIMVKIPAHAYELTKRELRKDAMERIHARRRLLDGAVDAVWTSDSTLSTIKSYLDGLAKR